MSDKMKKIGVILVVLGLMLTSTLGTQPRVFATSEEPTIESNVAYEEGKTKAKITLSVENNGKSEIKEVKDPAGNVMDVNNLVWTTNENGDYTFKVTYRNIENQEVKEIDKVIEVKEIQPPVQKVAGGRATGEVSLELIATDWSATGNTFTLTPFFIMPEDVKGGKLIIHLPKYIELKSNIQTEFIKKVSIEGSHTDENGTVITIELNDNVSGNTGVDISISQGTFISNSRVSDYDIQLDYQDINGNFVKSITKTFTPKINYDKDKKVTYELSKYMLLTATSMEFTLEADMDLTKFNDFNGYLIFPKDMVEFFHIDQAQGKLQSDGSLKIRIDEKDVWGNDKKTFKKEIKIALDAKDIVAKDMRYYTYDVQLAYDSGEKDHVEGDISFFYPEVTARSSENTEALTFNLVNAVQEKGTRGSMTGGWELTVNGVARNSQGTIVGTYGSGQYDYWKQFNKSVTNPRISFRLPDSLTWTGDSNLSTDNKAVKDLEVNFGLSSSGTIYKAGQFVNVGYVDARLAYDFKNPSPISQSEYLEDVIVSVEYYGKELQLNSSPYKLKVGYDNAIAVPIKRMYSGELAQESVDKELFSFAWIGADGYNSSGFDGRNMFAQTTEIPIDTNKIRIKKIAFNQEVLAKIKDKLNLQFYYETNVNRKKTKADLTTDIQLSDDEYVTKLWMDNDTYEYINDLYNDSSTFVTFYGDVLKQTASLVNYRLDIESTIVKSGLSAAKSTTKNSELVLLRKAKKTNFLESLARDKGNDVLYPGDITYYRLDMNNTYSADNTKTEEVVIHYDPMLMTNAKLIGVSNYYSDNYANGRTVEIKKATYTTNKNNKLQTKESPSNKEFDLNLPDGEYFTSLSLTISTKKMSTGNLLMTDFRIMFVVKNLFEEKKADSKDTLHFYMDDDEYYENNSVSYNKIEAKAKGLVNVTLSANDWKLFTSDHVNINEELDVSHAIYKYKDVAGVLPVESELLTRIVNPTFYYKIPRYLVYQKDSFAVNGPQLNGKKPKVSVVSAESNDYYYLKVEFYGDPASEHGLDAKIPLNNTQNIINFKLKVANYAKRGTAYRDILLYADLSNTREALQDVNSFFDIKEPSTVQITVGGEQIHANNPSSYSKRVTILQQANTYFLANVNTKADALLRNEATIRSGEEVNAFLDIINSATDLENFTMYVPVARSGRDDGKGVYEWDAKLLSSAMDSGSAVTLQYSTDANPTKNKLEGKEDPNGMYVNAGNIKNWDDVTMIKVIADKIAKDQDISITAKFKDRAAKTTKGSQEIKVSGYYSYSLQGSTQLVKGETEPVKITLNDTVISGYLFVDKNADGLLDKNDTFLSGKKVTLYDKNDNVVATDTSNADGRYSFIVSAIPEDGYMKVEKTKGLSYTIYKKNGNPNSIVSSFDPDTNKAYPNLTNSEELNAGFIETPDINAMDELTVKVKKSKPLTYAFDPVNNDITAKFSSADEKIATVDADGNVTGVSEGKTTVRVYYETKAGTKVYADVKVTVISNQAPIITTTKDVITMNVGDLWDAKDPSIVEGLAISDDHDKDISIDDLEVEDNLPVGGKFLFFFKTSNTDKLTKAGTFKVTYSYTDSDDNTSSKTITVKVNGQPYIKDDDGNTINTLSNYYYRLGSSLNQYDGIHAYWLKASDKVGEDPKETEILKDDRNTGIFTMDKAVDSDGNAVVGDPGKVGKYTGTFYIQTPSEAKSTASLEIDRILYARSQITFTAHNIPYSATADKKQFANWEEFYQEHREKLGIVAKVSTPDKDGKAMDIDFSKNVKAVTDISKLDFTLPDGKDYKEIPIVLEVRDDGKDDTLPANYGESTKQITVIVTVQKVVGEAPHIHYQDIQRIETDAIKKEATADSPDLGSDKAMAEAAAKGEHPIYDKLMSDIKVEDDTTARDDMDVSIISIKRVSNSSGNKQKDYDPKKETDLKAFMTTIGTYEIVYQAIDGDKNKVQATRKVEVAGKTHFVKSLDTYEPYEKTITVVQDSHGYVPEGVFAYHMDADEVTKHDTVVSVKGDTNIDISKPMTKKIIFETTHHYATYPGTAIARETDQAEQILRVNGAVEFNETNGAIKGDIIQHPIDLTNIKATYMKASSVAGEAPVKTSLKVVNDTGASSYTAKNPEEKAITFHIASDEEVQGSLDILYRISGKAEIKNVKDQSTLNVKENITQEEIKAKLNAQAEVILYDNSTLDLSDAIKYDFNNDAKGKYVELSVHHTVPFGSQTSSDTKRVYLNTVAKAEIKAKDIVYNVGDEVDLKKDSALSIRHDMDTPKLEDIVINGNVPLEGTKAKTAGTYKITFTYEDSVGNISQKDILVKVNGLPQISGIDDMEKRVGDSFAVWDKIQVTYLQAPDQEGTAQPVTYTASTAASIGAQLGLKDMKNVHTDEAVDFTSLNTPGYYSGIYYAVTPTGGKSEIKRTLLLHGQPGIHANNIVISVNDEESDNFIEKYKKELAISSSVVHAFKDKANEKIELTDKVKVKESKFRMAK